MTVFVALERIFGGIRELLSVLAIASFIVAWDSVLSLLNLFTPKREGGKVVLPGTLGLEESGQSIYHRKPPTVDLRVQH